MRIVISTKPVDFRKGHGVLAALAKKRAEKSPVHGQCVCVPGQAGGSAEVALLGRGAIGTPSVRETVANGLVMICKRLEETTFTWPTIRGGLMLLNHAQFEVSFVGLDWRKVKALAALN